MPSVKTHFIKVALVVTHRWSWWMPTWLFSSSSAQCISAWMHRSGSCGWVSVIDFLTLTLWNWKILDCSWYFWAFVLIWKLVCLQPLKLRWVHRVSKQDAAAISAAWRQFGCFSWGFPHCKRFFPGVFCWSFGVVAMSLGKHFKCISFCFRTDHRQLLLVGKPGSSATLASLTEHLGTALSF